MPDGALDSERTRVRRQPLRGRYERVAVNALLDAALFAHVGFVEAGQPYCIPMLHARVGDSVYIHGSSVSRAIKVLATGAQACLTVSMIDGLVLARSAFEHSANYRAAVILGSFSRVEDDEERLTAFAAFTNKLIPGRWEEVRPPNRHELKATSIMALPIVEASVKTRTGPPTDDDSADAAIDTWAGVLPLTTAFGSPQPAPGLRAGIPLSASAQRRLAKTS
jgi:nitroimidazol reductase NimA-like FMN-containing flavoprotein (pyridoxamine 5'-phosphate oxidase superfamily)